MVAVAGDWVAEVMAEAAELEAARMAERRSELVAAAGAWGDRSELRRRLELAEAEQWARFEGTAAEYVAERYGIGLEAEPAVDGLGRPVGRGFGGVLDGLYAGGAS